MVDVGDTVPGELGVVVADVGGDTVSVGVLLEGTGVGKVLVLGLSGRLVGSWLGVVDVVGDAVSEGARLEGPLVGTVLVLGLLELGMLVCS